jgi:nucleoside phosphorylase
MTLVCFAVKEEAAPFRKLAADRSDVEILLTGIGRQNSERAVRAAVGRCKPGLVLTCGFAGGLNPELALGTVVFSADAGSELSEKLLAAGARPARFHCAPRIATTAAEKQELRRATGADAVEMESQAIHAVCREHGIPCATVRVISDTADEDLPLDFNRLAKPDLSLDYGRLALTIAKSPGRIPALLRLRKNCRSAAERLAEVLSKVIWSK